MFEVTVRGNSCPRIRAQTAKSQRTHCKDTVSCRFQQLFLSRVGYTERAMGIPLLPVCWDKLQYVFGKILSYIQI